MGLHYEVHFLLNRHFICANRSWWNFNTHYCFSPFLLNFDCVSKHLRKSISVTFCPKKCTIERCTKVSIVISACLCLHMLMHACLCAFHESDANRSSSQKISCWLISKGQRGWIICKKWKMKPWNLVILSNNNYQNSFRLNFNQLMNWFRESDVLFLCLETKRNETSLSLQLWGQCKSLIHKD